MYNFVPEEHPRRYRVTLRIATQYTEPVYLKVVYFDQKISLVKDWILQRFRLKHSDFRRVKPSALQRNVFHLIFCQFLSELFKRAVKYMQ